MQQINHADREFLQGLQDLGVQDTFVVKQAIDLRGKVKVSADDTAGDVLEGKIVSSSGSLALTTLNPGANEQMDASASGLISPPLSILSGQALSALRVVVSNAAGKAIYADSSDVSHAERSYGLTITATGAADQAVTVLLSGRYSDASWAWDMTKPIWLGVNGALTQTSPATGFTQIVARPITATSLSFGATRAIVEV